MKEWRKHWKLSRFFSVLILGLASSLFDSWTDFNFAGSVPAACGNTTECGVQDFNLDRVSSPCGIFHYKEVKRLTYTYIAFPGFFLGYSSLQCLVASLFRKCWRGEIHASVRGLAGTFAVALECSLFVVIYLAAIGHNDWACALPHLAEIYDYTIQGMAYLSAAFTIGVKCLGTVCHGPTSCRLLLRAKGAEAKFEAAFQLGLLSRIFLSSGIETSAGLLSAISSIFVIGINGIQNFLQRHEEKLSEASILGKICVAASVLPVFLLTTLFKFGAAANNEVWKGSGRALKGIIALGLPALTILCLKMCKRLEDLPWAHVNQCVISDLVSLHLWPKSRDGKRIGLAMAVFTFLLFASRGPFLIASPVPTTHWTSTEGNNPVYNMWASKTGDRLKVASISFLAIGSIAFVLVICLILFEDNWVAKIVSKFPNHSKQEDDADEGLSAVEVEIDSKNKTTYNPREEKDAEVVKKDEDSNACDLVLGKGGAGEEGDEGGKGDAGGEGDELNKWDEEMKETKGTAGAKRTNGRKGTEGMKETNGTKGT